MPNRAFSTFTDQFAERLRQGMVEDHWRGTPTVRTLLARDPGVSPMAVAGALNPLY